MILYKKLPEADDKAIFLGAGLPEEVASLLAVRDVGATKGALFNDSRQLSTLIGPPTTPLGVSVSAALAAA
jgi:NAD(P)H dehydrogenase (quinone)